MELTEIAELPTTVAFAITDICNLKCVQCGHSLITSWKHTSIPAETIKALMANATYCCIHGVGEVLTHPHWSDYISDTARGVGFFSNGLLLNERNLDLVLEKKIAWINISVDAGTPEIYAKIRGGDWKLLWENIDRALAKRGSNAYPDISLSMAIMKANMHTVPDLAREAVQRNLRVYYHHLNTGCDFTVPWNGGFEGIFSYKDQEIADSDRPLHDAKLLEAKAIAEGRNLLFLTGRFFDKNCNSHPL